MILSYTEENYLKALLKLTSENGRKEAGTNELAVNLVVKPATANDMLKKLKEKKLINYEKYGKITMTDEGIKNATEVVRKHRLWETFLYQKLEFTWDEVHEVAEQLEHIQSVKLVERLAKFLNYPEVDPHGDPIPNENGEFTIQYNMTLSSVEVGHSCIMVAVKDKSTTFLKYVVKVGLCLNNVIQVLSKQEYDSMIEIEVNGKRSMVGQKFAENIYVI